MNTDSLKSLFGTEEALALLDSQSIIFLALAIAILWIGKVVNDLCTPYKLSHELTTKDNKAIAVSFSGSVSYTHLTLPTNREV